MKIATLAENLVYQRKLKGFTQEQLSDQTTVGVRTIQRIEKGETQPHLQTIKLLAAGLNVEVNDLVPIEDPNEEAIQRKWMILLHISPFFGFFIPFANVIFPIILWTHKADDNKIYDQHGRAIINFHCSIFLYLIFSLLFFFILPGFNFFLTGFIVLFSIILSIKNLFSAINQGTCKFYLSIPFIKEK